MIPTPPDAHSDNVPASRILDQESPELFHPSLDYLRLVPNSIRRRPPHNSVRHIDQGVSFTRRRLVSLDTSEIKLSYQLGACLPVRWTASPEAPSGRSL
jgi:hypothetical protein